MPDRYDSILKSLADTPTETFVERIIREERDTDKQPNNTSKGKDK
jgi:hypothetical protein